MTRRTTRAIELFMIGAVLAVSAACGERPAGYAAPASPTPIPTTVGAPPTTTVISVGQTVRATVTPADAPCDLGHGPQPCVRYRLVPVVAGGLRVQLSAPGPNELALLINGLVTGYGVERVETTVVVRAGLAYDVTVALTDARSGSTSQAYELTTSLTP
ncbi:MAG: hypothetical protein ABI665_21290 [Vicinamibacterales bacterium]